MNLVSLQQQDHIAVITIDHPPVNALSRAVLSQLAGHLSRLADQDGYQAIILRGANGKYSAGADISEFGLDQNIDGDEPDLTSLFNGLAIPVFAAIEGVALGGGLELALLCDYRLATPEARLGLPEVHLGLLPGGGGTQRLPRLVGPALALDFMLSGRPINTAQAMECGLVDATLDADAVLESALTIVREKLGTSPARRRIDSMSIDLSSMPGDFLERANSAVTRHPSGFFAPQRIVECVKAAVELPIDKGLEQESALFLECLKSSPSAALRYLFFAERQTHRIPDIPPGTQAREIQSAAVIGSGTMGGGIAMCFANAGIPVYILDIDNEALQRGLGLVRANYTRSVRKGRMSEEELERRMSLIQPSTDYEDLHEADLVVEAVFENMALKKDIFRRLDGVARPGAILASNTSSLDLDEIAAVTSRPGDVVGLHFFSPANVMRLLEVVRGRETSFDVMASAMKLARKLGKIGVQSGVCPGFIGNRIVAQYGREATLMMLEGVSPERLDSVLLAFGFPMGPCAVGDMVGLDIGVKAADEARLKGDWNGDERDGAIGRALVEAGRLGLKSGAGYYRYEPGSRRPLPEAEVPSLISKQAERLKIEPREISDEEITHRCLYSMINEAARILAEGIALRPADIDVVMVYGYGFPRTRGGLMHYADEIGLQQLVARIQRFQDILGDRYEYWSTAPLLQELAGKNQKFKDWTANPLRTS